MSEPAKRRVVFPRSPNNRWPWDTLEIGESFTAPAREWSGGVASTISMAGKKLGKRFRYRSEAGNIIVERVE